MMTSNDTLIKNIFRLSTYHRRKIWWITSRVILLTLVLTALGLAFRPRFVARTKLTMLPTRSEIGFVAQRPEMLLQSPAAALGQTSTETLSSRSLAEEVARTLLANNREELNNGGVLGHVRQLVVAPLAGLYGQTVAFVNTGRWKSPDPFMSLVEAIQSRTKVQNVPGSYVFQISVTWENPKIAAAIANLLAERYIQMTLQANKEEMRIMREFIETRTVETRDELAALEKRINEYRVGEKLYAASTDLDLGLQERSLYQRELSAVRVSRAQLDARIDALKPYQTPAALAAIEAERSEMKTREEMVAKVMDEQMGKLDKLPAKQAGLQDLYRVRLGLERTLSALQDRMLDTKITEAAQLSAVRIIDRAIPAAYPEGPLMIGNALSSLIVGLLLSAGVVLVFEARRPGLRSREDLSENNGRMLGLIPYVATRDHTLSGPDDPDAEAARGILGLIQSVAHGRYGSVMHRRTAKRHMEHLLQHLGGDSNKRINLMISLNGREGKTYLIEHVAKLAKEAGLKILAVDANLHNPELHVKFGKPLTAGLAEMLAGKATAKEVLVTVEKGISMIGAGLVRMNPQGKWAVDAVRRELEQLMGEYDLILIDTAALRSDASVIRLLPLASAVICVFDATTSQRSDAAELRHRLGPLCECVNYVLNKKMYGNDYLYEASMNGARAEPLAKSRETVGYG